jgi:hypothetical protein
MPGARRAAQAVNDQNVAAREVRDACCGRAQDAIEPVIPVTADDDEVHTLLV